EEVIARLPGIDLDLAQRIISSPSRPFHVKEELLLLEGCDKSFDQCKDFISVYSNGKVNVNTAPVEVLTALGIDSQVASIIEEFRKGPDLEEATEDDEVFENTGEIVDKLNSFRSLLEQQQEMLLGIIEQGAVTVESENFTMQIEANILNKTAMRYVVVMDAKNIKQWQEF
ncbi:MAG: general secretion pathway protein GspK, partial [Candidatus Omnitrophica bacterium]|nr:general secretion pathway protein GspK [Candidatus Omnitrophota bacterium]